MTHRTCPRHEPISRAVLLSFREDEIRRAREAWLRAFMEGR